MWFDVRAASDKIEGGTKSAPEVQAPATSATTATQAGRVAKVAGVATHPTWENETRPTDNAPHVAVVARVATPPAQKPETKRPARDEPRNRENYPHGLSCGGRPLTWTGRVVSLAAWRQLSEWERHGPRGRMWNGLTQQWEEPEGNGT